MVFVSGMLKGWHELTEFPLQWRDTIRPKAFIVPAPSSEYAWWIFLMHQRPLTYRNRMRPTPKIAEKRSNRNDPKKIKTTVP